MFISSHDLVRKHGPLILGVILAVSVGMGLLFTPSGSLWGGRQSQRGGLPTIGGKPVNSAEFQALRNNVLASVAMARGRQPVRTAAFEDDLNIKAVQQMVLLRKARELGIRVADEDVVRQIRSLPVMLNEQRQFDPGNYQRYMIVLNNLGISETQFEDVIRTDLTLARLGTMIGASMEVAPAEMRETYNMLEEQTRINYVELNAADHKDTSTITDEEARAYYSANLEKFRTPAMVKVRYVYFTNADARKSITIGDDDLSEYYERNKNRYLDASGQPKPLAEVKDELRSELLNLRADQAAGNRAQQFTVDLATNPDAAPSKSSPPSFTEHAAKSGLPIRETDFFGLRSRVSGVGTNKQFNQAAFALGPDIPLSDVVRGEDGYYVLQYVASKPSEIPPFDEVKPQVIERIRQQRSYEATVKLGRDLDARIKAAVAAGTNFTTACAAVGLTPKTSEPFTFIGETTNLPYASTIKQVVLGMATNAVSDFFTSPTGGIFFHLMEREEPKPLESEQARRQLEAQLLQQNREALYEDWANSILRTEQVDYKRKAPPPQQQPPAEESEPAEEPAPTS
ncbi:MAG TPA: peptidyl-prolyl cis-trans isomerase [Verrucomicrobiae bacterium]|nr:peptidyl-prolyl cis-trans isomerase [Verrucomicrobiae bacterium]